MVPDVVPLAEAILGKRSRRSWTPSGGHSSAARLVVELDDGSSCFVKAATDDRSAEWLRTEYRLIYSQLNATFVPRVLGWADDGNRPLLILEDLSHAHWPPPWTHHRVEQVRHTLNEVRRTTVDGAPDVTPVQGRNLELGWRTVRADPAPFLALGPCTRSWLDKALPLLIDAASGMTIDGDDLVHYDVRSDNLCFAEDRVVLIDWNWTAFISGYYAARAPIQPTPDKASVRARQLEWLAAVLPWAARTLDLPRLADHVE